MYYAILYKQLQGYVTMYHLVIVCLLHLAIYSQARKQRYIYNVIYILVDSDQIRYFVPFFSKFIHQYSGYDSRISLKILIKLDLLHSLVLPSREIFVIRFLQSFIHCGQESDWIAFNHGTIL